MRIEIPSPQVKPLLRPFLLSQKQGRDVITRSILLVPQGDRAWVYSTDGISHLRARIPATIDNFTDPVVLDLNTFHTLLRAEGEWAGIEKKGDVHWGDFYGGQIHLQTYAFDPDLFRGRIPKRGGKETEVSTAEFLTAIESLHKIIETSDVSDLCYLFFTSKGAFASNGSMVAKVEGEFPEVSLRKRDCKLVQTLLELEESDTFHVKIFKDRVMVRTTYLDYVFPCVNHALSDRYKSRPGASVEYFRVPNEFLRHVLKLVNGLPDSTGVITFDFEEKLSAQLRGRKGQVSNFLVSADREGPPSRMKVQTLSKTALLASNVFDRTSDINLGVRMDGSLLMWDENKALNFVTKPALG